ncbi:MAG: methylated-DNA--[protein]-cysteine S-methyltransferase [Gemmatimonadaceae bacterium]|nr:methylated-DNA--[protein]-cysteine S-methyltransferase [Gemmatimonadaceae bacterium]
MTEPVYYTTMPSPVGTLTLAAREAGLVGVYFELRRHGPPTQEALAWRPDDGTAEPASRVLKTARHQLEAYFAGTLRAFDVPLAARGTAFQRAVWAELRKIPYGGRSSYGEMARRLGNSGASRAVGAANGRNPISIVVPCHRVVGADGSLTGFGGGIERKRWLLNHETRQVG